MKYGCEFYTFEIEDTIVSEKHILRLHNQENCTTKLKLKNLGSATIKILSALTNINYNEKYLTIWIKIGWMGLRK